MSITHSIIKLLEFSADVLTGASTQLKVGNIFPVAILFFGALICIDKDICKVLLIFVIIYLIVKVVLK